MWARKVEIGIALWLAASPFVFGYARDDVGRWVNDFGCAVLIAGAALLSHASRFRRAHLVSLAVAAWLVGLGWNLAWSTENPSPIAENWVGVGLVLLIFAIVPSEALQPPMGWRRTSERRISERKTASVPSRNSPSTLRG